jgi:hypothetical protein
VFVINEREFDVSVEYLSAFAAVPLRCAESLWLSGLCFLFLCEAVPRNWQGIALPEIKVVANGKAEPFRTEKRQSRKKG